MSKEQPPALFDTPPDWTQEWQGMPEFIQDRKREYAKIIVRFRCQKDLDEFAGLIGQRLNRNSQCTWHPELKSGELQPKAKYIHES
jgi:hypothetical protein